MYHRPRLIPCLLLSDGGLVKTVRFKDPNYLGDPINAVKIFSEKCVDELCVQDIQASREGRGPDFALLEDIASEAFMPLSYGGGVTTVEQAARLFHIGFEKVILNTALIDRPELVRELAERFGSGKVVPTVRMTLEVVGIPYERIDEAVHFGAQRGLRFGGTGAKVRPVTSCKGTTCVFGMYDTQAVAREIHEKYYLGWDQVALPHKFKIAVGGCPNSCVKPSLNDFGIEGRRTPEGVRFQVYLGGTWGRTTRMGTPYPRLWNGPELVVVTMKRAGT